MVEFRPLIAMVLIIFVIAIFLNFVVSPHLDLPTPVEERAVEAGFAEDFADASDIVSSQPVIDFISTQIELWDYIPSWITTPLFIIFGIVLLLTIVSIFL